MVLVEALWERPVYEDRLFAVLLLCRRAELVGVGDLPLLRRFVREAGTWALVDPLAVTLLGALVDASDAPAGARVDASDASPAELVGERLEEWVLDDSFWVRRAALLSQLGPLKRGAPFARFGRWADALLGEREFFIAKAIGWVLRETSKTRPGEVARWLLPRASDAAPVTVREAVKYLPAADREAILAVRAGLSG